MAVFDRLRQPDYLASFVPDSTVLRPCLTTGLPLSEQSAEKELYPPHEKGSASVLQRISDCLSRFNFRHFDESTDVWGGFRAYIV